MQKCKYNQLPGSGLLQLGAELLQHPHFQLWFSLQLHINQPAGLVYTAPTEQAKKDRKEGRKTGTKSTGGKKKTKKN